MTDINQLSSASSLTAGDLLPLWSSANSDTRKASMSALQDFLQSNLSFSAGQFVVQYAAPAATGFSVTMPNNTNNQWLIMSPLASYGSGTITFPLSSTLTDNQEILIYSTQAVSTLTLAGNGASIIGATIVSSVVSISTNSALWFKYNLLANTWYLVGANNTSTYAFLTAAQTFTQQQTLTSGLVLQSLTAASIAAIANAINTTNKVAGKVVFDTTNNRLMVSSGSAAASAWFIADGSGSVVPA